MGYQKFLVGLCLILSACSPSVPSDNLSGESPQIQALSVLSLVSGSGDFGEIGRQPVLATLTIRNLGAVASEPAQLSVSGTDASSFQIVYSAGCSQALTPGVGSCVVKIKAGPRPPQSSGTQLSAILHVGQLAIPLSATAAEMEDAELQLLEGTTPLEYVAFGTLVGSQTLSKNLAVKNLQNFPSLVNVSLVSSAFTLVSNGCAERVLPPNGSCSFKLIFSASGKSSGAHGANLMINETSRALSAMVAAPVLGEAGGVLLDAYVNNQMHGKNEVINLGLFPSASGISQIISFKNSGIATSTPLNLSLTGANADKFSIVSSSCQNRVLAAGASCSFRVVFSALSKSAGVYQAALNFSDQIYPVYAEVAASTACPANSHKEGAICVRDPLSCVIANGQGQQTYAGIAYGSCQLLSCNSGYHAEANACANDVQACGVANGVGSQSWNGSAYSACAPVACDSSFHIEANACISDVRACVVADGAGEQSWLGSSYGSCVAVSCNANYHVEADSCVHDIRACAIADGAGSQSWLGNQYSSCTLQSCNSGFHADGNSCAANIISCAGEIPFAATATKTWNGSAYGSCQLSACQSEFAVSGQTCQFVQNSVSYVGTGGYATCAMYPNGQVRCGGYDGRGTVGNNGVTALKPVVIPALQGTVKLSVGLQTVNAILSDGRVMGQGWNEYGTLGIGHFFGILPGSEGALVPTEIPQWFGATKVANGYYHTCALLANGNVSCTGKSSVHEFGIVLEGGNQAPKIHTPVVVAGLSGARDLEVGQGFTCAVLLDNRVKCVGDDPYGAFGFGTYGNNYSVPIELPSFFNPKQLAPGATYMCARLQDDSVICSGGGGVAGGLGSAITIPGMQGATKLIPLHQGVCALMPNNDVKCMGYDLEGAFLLGQGLSAFYAAPTVIGFPKVKDIFGRYSNLCAIDMNDKVVCAGSNPLGSLSNNTTTDAILNYVRSWF